MATYDQIINQLEKKQFAPVYLLHGTEPFYIDLISDYIEENAIQKEHQDFNQVIFYGKDSDAEEIATNAKEFPFGSDKRVVIVKEAKELKSIEKLAAYMESPSSTSILVICYKYLDAKAAFVKAAEKKGVVFKSAKVPDYKLAEWVQNRASFHQFKINAEASYIISEHIGNDLSRIDNEFKKLQILIPKGSEITPVIIEKHIGISKEYNVFELQKALADRNKERVYKITLNFCDHLKENPNVKTISNLFSFYSKMLAYQLSDKSNLTASKIFGINNDWILKQNITQASSFSVMELRKNISILREYDAKSKGVDSTAPEEELLKEMMFKICG
ncbi:MAG TPA: DNA polymerase III subunit delta [Bacteroidales bacterium]|jgi:DNA polymerase-3 subunit delta|nr:DNA polymerase III subunit delta [Bacteroidales bacterium]HPS72185.1 DNA polymerase III subunit delta [Bacteroidales bacterium]